MLRCSKCKEIKSYVYFDKARREKSGYRSQCKLCRHVVDREYYANNKEKMKTYMAEYTRRLEDRVYNIIPNRCYYESGRCSGELQWDHKHGDGKNDRVPDKNGRTGSRWNRRQLLNRIIDNPDRWMRLCERHNKMKIDMPKEMFEAEILEMAERIKKRDYGYLLSGQPFQGQV